MKERDIICGECGEVIGGHATADDSTTDGQAEATYFQFFARDDMNAHVEESKTPHTGSTRSITFGPWKVRKKPEPESSAHEWDRPGYPTGLPSLRAVCVKCGRGVAEVLDKPCTGRPAGSGGSS